MGKKKSHKHKQQHKYELTKHQLGRQEKLKKRQRIFLIVGICVISVVGGVLGGGWYKNDYLPMHEPAIRVNDTELNMAYYVNALDLQARVYEQYYGEEEISLYMQYLAGEVETFIEQGELMKQAAEDLGIVVTDAEVNAALKENDPPLGKEYRELMRYQLLTQRLLDEHFDAQVSVSAPQRNIMIMLLESQSQADDVRARLTAGEDFATVAGEVSLENFSAEGDGNLGWYPQGILSDIVGLSVVEDYAFASGAGDLSQPIYEETRSKNVGYWLAELMEKDEDETGELYHLRVMILGSEAEAQDIKARLESGEDFGELAEQYSQHDDSKDDGGDLDWLTPDDIYEPLEDFVLNAEAGSLSEIVKDTEVVTEGGYWLVKVTEQDDNREITEEYRDILKAKIMDDWLQALLNDPQTDIESYLDTDKKEWAIERALS